MAIKNPAATSSGGLNTLISVDTTKIYDALPTNIAVDTNLVATFIGGATQAVEDSRAAYATKALQFKLITVSTNSDALVNGVAGWYNRTGQTAPVGKYIVAVAA
jgi:hypothetical protein